MKARAPGKLVLSGAYAVLEGAPALVTAVDRYVEADSARGAEFVTPEVRAALGDAPAPWFDASALREGDRKLGLGSSAAILVSSLAALELERDAALGDAELAELVFARALAAHRAAQGGGSGVDIAAATYGGTLCFTSGSETPEHRAVTLPTELVVEAWWSGQPASTPELIGRVAALAERDAAHHRALLDAQSEAAGASAVAVDRGDVDLLLRSLEAQRQALTALASAAEAAIVTPGAARLGECALAERGVALPAGAGGGDVLLFFGLLPSTSNFRALAAECGHVRLDLCFGARGVHRA